MHGYGQGMEKVDGSSLLNLEKGFLHLQFIVFVSKYGNRKGNIR